MFTRYVRLLLNVYVRYRALLNIANKLIIINFCEDILLSVKVFDKMANFRKAVKLVNSFKVVNKSLEIRVIMFTQ